MAAIWGGSNGVYTMHHLNGNSREVTAEHTRVSSATRELLTTTCRSRARAANSRRAFVCVSDRKRAYRSMGSVSGRGKRSKVGRAKDMVSLSLRR